MNRIARAVILSVAALTTVATTAQFASAGDRYWRRHHVVKHWNKRVVIAGVTAGVVAGAVIATRPRVIYRDDPVTVDEGRVYDPDSSYDDDSAYADPDADNGVGIYRDDAPEADDYAAPRDGESDDGQIYDDNRQAYDDDSGDGYFPDRPQANVERKSHNTVRKQATIEAAPRKQPKKVETIREADAADLKPWSKEWKQWCAGRFPSFNPQNGTYKGYDQKRHFCKAG